MRHREITDEQDQDNDIRRFLVWPNNQTQEEAESTNTHTEVTISDGCFASAGPADWDEVTTLLEQEYGVQED